MELSFTGGRFVSNRGELNYKEVLEHFPNASIIRIITYNISRNQRQDKLFEALRDTDAEIQLITNVPSRMEEYFDNEAGRSMRKTARRNIQIYIAKLNPENFSGNFLPYFNVHNHAKIIGTEDIVYIGSANFSNESADNIETGILIEDRDFISKLYSEFFDKVASESLSYLDDNFNAFHLFLLSLYAKFEHHYNILLRDVYTDYQRTRLVAADTIFIDTDEWPVKLTATEYKIVSLLMNNLGRVFSADEIYERVWNEEAYATENTVMVHIRRIREKIEIDAKNPRYLKVVWGIGYKIEKMD